ncbi:unnamed protein product [marine sediment metagenome]|uniref:guanylate kinase n=1 Tax=marine sediment metagenome TaxID=412755 RepID=X0XUL0_9ZZZZ
MAKEGKLIVISGPSGVGKSTVVREVLERTGAAFSVSMTTRAPRPGEVDGRDYRFVDRAEFEKTVQAGRMLEWAEVFGQCYGTPAGPIEEGIDAGRTVILDIDVQGGLQVAEKMPAATFVLILAPDEATLRDRLSGRGTEDAATVRRRFDKAADEIRAALDSGVYTHKVINDNLERAVDEVVGIVTTETQRR